MNKEYITPEKKIELENELDNLVNVQRKDIASALEYAKSLGDLSENAEYHQAREDQARLEDRIAEVEYILKNAEVVKSGIKSDTVKVGTIVIVKKKGSKTEQTFTIVGSAEADVAEGKISNESPLGHALISKKEGEVATFHNPKGEEVSYIVVDIK